MECLKTSDFIGRILSPVCLRVKAIAVPCVLIQQGILNTYSALNCVFRSVCFDCSHAKRLRICLNTTESCIEKKMM